MEHIVIEESYEQYVLRVEDFFHMNNTPEHKKITEFIRLGGPELFRMVTDINTFEEIRTTPYKEFKFKLEQYLKIRRRHFQRCVQASGQSIKDFAFQIETRSKKCLFEEHFRKEAILKQFVYGVKSNRLQDKLIAEPKLNFTMARFIAMDWEADASRKCQRGK